MLKEIAISFGIAVILPFLIYFGVNTIVPKPDDTESLSRHYGPSFFELSEEEQQSIRKQDSDRFAKFFEGHRRNVKAWFYTSLALGYSFVIVGAMIRRIGLGSGFMFGGTISLGSAYLRAVNLDYLNNDFTSASLLFGIGLFVFLGLKKLKDRRAEQAAGGDVVR